MGLWSLATGAGGWLLGFWQNHQERKRGIEEGAQAAFSGFESAMPAPPEPWDRKRLSEVFKDDDRTEYNAIHETAMAAGEVYAEIIRREAFRDAWEAAYGEDMPPVGYQQGHLAAIRDVVKGATEVAPGIISLWLWTL